MSEAVTLIASNPTQWAAATQHPFLVGVRDGTLPEPAFRVWLVQDYLFVEALARAQARIAAAAPRAHMEVLAGGVVGALEELRWFERQAQSMGVSLAAEPLPPCQAYCDFLFALTYAPYPAQITAIWALERVYLEAWTFAGPGAASYQEFVRHWTQPEFRTYVGRLEACASEALADAPAPSRREAERAFLQVLRYERDFWAMAWPG